MASPGRGVRGQAIITISIIYGSKGITGFSKTALESLSK